MPEYGMNLEMENYFIHIATTADFRESKSIGAIIMYFFECILFLLLFHSFECMEPYLGNDISQRPYIQTHTHTKLIIRQELDSVCREMELNNASVISGISKIALKAAI